MVLILLCSDLFTFLSLLVRDPEKWRGFLKGNKKRPPESGFSEAFFKEYLLQVLPETTLPAHRQTGITAIEPWRLYLLVCVRKLVFICFTCVVKKSACPQAPAHNELPFRPGQSKNAVCE